MKPYVSLELTHIRQRFYTINQNHILGDLGGYIQLIEIVLQGGKPLIEIIIGGTPRCAPALKNRLF